jgi:cyclic pyranopterin phosphate synthase
MTITPQGDSAGVPLDTRGRALRDLRISVTDRCNFRCRYCMPRERFGPGHEFLGVDHLLSFDEITRLARIFVGIGVRKIRLTGGEPLLRPRIERLVRELAELPDVDLAMTTNGALLRSKLDVLVDAGLSRVTVSLDSLDTQLFQELTDSPVRPEEVLRAIDAAQAAGLGPVKVNMVVMRGRNQASVLPLAERFRGTGVVVRFIEYMDVGNTNGWRSDHVVTGEEIVAEIASRHPLEPVDGAYAGEVASRYRYRDGAGEIGVIASVTRPFCGDCTRARLSADGQVYTCLFSSSGHDVRQMLRSGATDDDVRASVVATWLAREDRYSELRGSVSSGRVALGMPRVEMSYIGG